MPPLVTARDLEILAALDRFPLTALQLLKLSRTFAEPLTTERRTRERLRQLAAAEQVRRWRYAIAGPGMPAYFTLSPEGFDLLHGSDASRPSKRAFAEIGVARQFHAYALSDFLVHFFVAAHASGCGVFDFERENACRLHLGPDILYPDAALRLRLPTGAAFRYFVELDNSTERVRSASSPDSWERKLRLYDRLAADREERFRLLIVTTRSPTRLAHLLTFAQEVAGNKERRLAYGVHLPEFLAADAALLEACFLDQRLRPTALLAPLRFANAAAREDGRLPSRKTAVSCYDELLAAALTSA